VDAAHDAPREDSVSGLPGSDVVWQTTLTLLVDGCSVKERELAYQLGRAATALGAVSFN